MKTIPFMLWVFLTVQTGCLTSEKKPTLHPQSFKFTKQQSASAHKFLLESSATNGQVIDQKKSHSLNGVVKCHTDGPITTCYLLARLPSAPFLASSKELSKEMSRKLGDQMNESRPDIVNKRIRLADIDCHYLGTEAPPKGLTDTNCVMDHVRSPTETIFDNDIAEKLFNLLSNKRNTESVIQTSGMLSCDKDSCIVRHPPSATELKKERLVNTELGKRIYARLSQTAYEYREIYSHDPEIARLKIPSTLEAHGTCTSSKMPTKSGSIRLYSCRISQ